MRAAVLLVALLAAPALAGCLSDSSGSSGSAKRVAAPVSQAPDAVTFVATLPDGGLADAASLAGLPPLKGVQRFLGHGAGEPMIAITPKGSLFMSAAGGSDGYTTIMASFDQGASWKDVSNKLPTGQNNPPVTLDPFVFGDPITGRIYSADLTVVCNYLSFTDDEGKTWTSDPVGCGQPVGVQDHQSLTTGKPHAGTPTVGYPNLVYYCVNRLGDSACAMSNNGGLTFGPLIPVMPGVDVERGQFCGGLHGHVKTDHAGRVFLGKNQCGLANVGISEDDGKTWNVVTISKTEGVLDHDVEIAADEQDNVYAFWISEKGKPLLSVSQDHGKTWSRPRDVAPPGVTATDKPAIDAKGPGKIAFSYIGTTAPKGYATKAWDGVDWNGYVGIMTDALAPDALVLTATVNPLDDPIAKGECGGTRCDGMYDFFDVKIDPQGRVWTAMVDVCNADCLTSGKNDHDEGFAGTLATGPALTAEGGALPALPDVVVKQG